MGNVPYVSTVRKNNRTLFVAVCSATVYEDGFKGSSWWTYDEDGNPMSHGYSKGWDGEGAGSALTAMQNGRASAHRHLRRMTE